MPETIVNKDPDRCPVCGSPDIEGEHVEIENINGVQLAFQRCQCAACGAKWTDQYRYDFSIVDG
jgi:transposase-like protein